MADTTPAPMSAEDLREIKARADAATPGPWSPAPQIGPPRGCDMAQVFASGKHLACIEPTEDPGQASDTASFIAHARTDVPALLAEIARLRKRMNEDGDAITQAVLAEIREILNAAGVPEATWVDDHVRNAVAEIAQLREDLTATKENRDLYLRQAQWREEDMRDAEARAAAAEARLAEAVPARPGRTGG